MLLANEKLMDRIFPKGWEVLPFYFALMTMPDLLLTGNTEGAPSPAEWKHLGNFTEKAEGSARHQTPKLKSTE